MAHWQNIQESIRNCRTCQRLEGTLFTAFKGNWPILPQPSRKAILFISEAPPIDGGFWTIQPLKVKQDDLREKLLPLLKLSPSGSYRGLKSFCDSGYFLLQSFPRPLKSSIGNTRLELLKSLLDHPVHTHLQQQIAFFQPAAILALGKPATTSLSMLFPNSKFAKSFQNGDFRTVQGKIFEELNQPLLSATYLPSGNGRFWRRFWEKHIPLFVRKARSLA